MKILIYGDSNTWGQIPNINGYNKNNIPLRYPKNQIWWNELTKENKVTVNGLCGRSIAHEHPILKNRNALKTIDSDLSNKETYDLVILQLGTNDCKAKYNDNANDISQNMFILSNKIKELTKAQIMILSPAKINENTLIGKKYYAGSTQKLIELNEKLKKICFEKNYLFVPCVNCEVGLDGEHLTQNGHKQVGKKVLQTVYLFKNEPMNCFKK